jgi:hypothetical protein
MNNLIKESLIVGVFISVLGLLLHHLASMYIVHDMNDYKIFGYHLFIIGVLGHLILEYFGVNKMYCLEKTLQPIL